MHYSSWGLFFFFFFKQQMENACFEKSHVDLKPVSGFTKNISHGMTDLNDKWCQ